MINAKLQNLYNIKNDIGTAIVNKGGTITESTPFYSYAGEIDNISTGPGSYSGWVVQDITGSKYTSITNISTGNINGPNIAGTNEAVMPFVVSANSYGGTVDAITINNGFVYAGGYTNQTVQKYHESNLAFVGNTANYGGLIFSVKTNNGFLYVVGSTNRTIQKYHESNLAFVGATNSYGGDINELAINNGFLYVGGATAQTIKKFYESNLVFHSNSSNYGGGILALAINNGFVYAGGGYGSPGNQQIHKFYESNLTFVSATPNIAVFINITSNNGYLYGGTIAGSLGVLKFYESNLANVGNSADLGGRIDGIIAKDNFVYTVGGGGNITKIYENNLVLLTTSVYNTGATVLGLAINNGYLYAGGQNEEKVKKYNTFEITYEQLPTYAFNRWLLNNSAGTPLLTNTVLTLSGSNINGPNLAFNQANMAYLNDTNSYSGSVFILLQDNNFIYAAGGNGTDYSTHWNASYIKKWWKNNFSYVGNSSFAGNASTVGVADNSNIYTAQNKSNNVLHYSKTTLALISSTPNVGSRIDSLAVDDTWVYVGLGGLSTAPIRRYFKSNLAFVNNSSNFAGSISVLHIDGNNIYTSSDGQQNLRVLNRFTFADVASATTGGPVYGIVTTNDFLFLTQGAFPHSVRSYYKNNLVLINTLSTNQYPTLATDNQFLYVTNRAINTISKVSLNNISNIIGNTQSNQFTNLFLSKIAVDSQYIYASGYSTNSSTAISNIKRYAVNQVLWDNIPTYSITSLKEE
jgi:hypothetical protein